MLPVMLILALHPYQGLCVWIGLLVQKKLGHLIVTAVGGDVQGRQVVVGNVVHGHVVPEQELDTVEVVPLSGHVERRQTVLQVEHRERKRKKEKEEERERHRQTRRQMDRQMQSIRMCPVLSAERLGRKVTEALL